MYNDQEGVLQVRYQADRELHSRGRWISVGIFHLVNVDNG